MQEQQISKTQLKYCEDMLNKISKYQNAYPFLEPVDPVALNIPDYFDKIKNPMDLSTIKNKLKNNNYTKPEEVKEDMSLMFSNCYLYNPKESQVHKMGLELEKQFNNLYNKMPTTINETVKKKRKSETKVSESIESKKPKIKGSLTQEEKNICEKIIEEIHKPKNSAIVWPFLEPISDDVIPGYSQVIKNPTDLKKIKRKLDQNEFANIDEFYKELKLMVNNCYKFNQDVKKIYDCAMEAERLFDSLIMREKSNKIEIIKKISDLRNSINIMEKEIAVLEEALSEDEKIKKKAKEYTMEERLNIGKQILELNQIQTTRIAQIVSKGGVNIDFLGKNEVELDMRVLTDGVLFEIEEYIKNVNNIKNKENNQNENELEMSIEI
ncbi:hypothetical protein BDAP_001421 [Binucleata daphniae]